jgi:hypothetical protein
VFRETDMGKGPIYGRKDALVRKIFGFRRRTWGTTREYERAFLNIDKIMK